MPAPSSLAVQFGLATPTGPAAALLGALGVRPGREGGWLDEDVFTATFGRWRLSTPRANVVAAHVTGPYAAWRAVGPRLSLTDRGLTFGTGPGPGLCVEFAEPVPGIEPTGLVRHPSLTVTVAEPTLLADALGHRYVRQDLAAPGRQRLGCSAGGTRPS